MGAVRGLPGPDEAPRGARLRSLGRLVFWHFTWRLMWLLNRTLWRMRSTGTEGLPRKAPFLLLPNHSAALDPFWVASELRPSTRYSSFMAASSLLAVPIAGKLLMALGAFPKQKFVKDASSMAELERLYNNGEVIVIFPEGDRTWDGRMNPVPPGIGRLIHRMGANVVYARMRTAHLATPRWSSGGFRWIPNFIEYDGPYHFTPDTSPEEITAHVREHIQTEPARDPSQPAWGSGLAVGLPDLLWACLHCKTVDGLQVDRSDTNRVVCGRCSAAWRVDLDAMLHGEGEHPTLRLGEAREALAAHFGTPPVLDRAAFEDSGLVMQDSEGALMRLERGKAPVEDVRGQLRLTRDRLSLVGPDGAERWGRDLLELDSVTIEVKNQIFVRSGGVMWRLDVPPATRLRWGLVTSAWHLHRKPWK